VQLSEALESFTKLKIPEGTTWEIIVVDNGSTDATANVIRSFEQALPIKRVFQPKPGISNARNAAVDAAQGKYLIWTDDDVQVAPNWLAAYVNAFKRWPEAAVFGGKITPYLVPPTPAWFQDAFDYVDRVRGGDLFARRDFGPDPVPLSIANDRIPFGACYAVRAAEQRQFRYDPTLGRAPGQYRGGEETAVIEEILKANHSGWWVPAAEVKHMVPSSRQSLQGIVQIYGGMGEEWAYQTRKTWRWTFLQVPVKLWVKLPLCYLRFRLAYMMQSKSWPHHFGRLAWYRAVFKYCFCELPLKEWILPGCEQATGPNGKRPSASA
jgi:glycosyltransferase involved in cell wall biosynthesis